MISEKCLPISKREAKSSAQCNSGLSGLIFAKSPNYRVQRLNQTFLMNLDSVDLMSFNIDVPFEDLQPKDAKSYVESIYLGIKDLYLGLRKDFTQFKGKILEIKMMSEDVQYLIDGNYLLLFPFNSNRIA